MGESRQHLADSLELPCPCCLGAGTVASDAGTLPRPLCEGHTTVPEEVAQRFLEAAAKRLAGGRTD